MQPKCCKWNLTSSTSHGNGGADEPRGDSLVEKLTMLSDAELAQELLKDKVRARGAAGRSGQ